MVKKIWLLKTEPDVFGIKDLAQRPQQTEAWDGIRNYQARNFIRDHIQPGDCCFIYHSQCKNAGIAGTAKVVSEAYADPAQFNPESDYYDPKATQDKPRWFCMDIQLVEIFSEIIPLSIIKQQPELQEMVLLKQGRLSVQPVTQDEWKIINGLATN